MGRGRQAGAAVVARKGLGLSRVAAAAGVSVATVSNTVNRPEIVSEPTRLRVLAAMRELDYVPNRAAATLRVGSNRLLGLVVPEIVNPFYAAITEAIAVEAGRSGYALALCVSHDDPEVERRHFEMLAEQRAAGAIVVPLGATGERLTQLRMVGTHLVLIDRVVDEHDGCSVAMDDVLGGRVAIEHLLASSSSSGGVTLVNGPTSIPQCFDRRRGVLEAVADHGGGERIVEFEGAHMTVDDGVEIGRRIAESGAPQRIFCTNDQLAVGVIRGLRESGIRVPADARVVGYGDLALATEGDVQITSVAQPKSAMGQIAVRKVLSEIVDRDEHHHTTTVFPPELVVRESAPRDGA
jgi:LacI family transcriptional regulator